MSLPLVFRIAGVWLGLWAIMSWFAPEQWAAGSGWTMSPDLNTLMQAVGMCAASLCVLHLALARWGGENISKFALVAGVMWALSTLLNVYHLSVGAIALNGMNIFGLVVGAIITLLFFLRAKA